VNVGRYGVEQAFMPAAKLLKKSASAAEGHQLRPPDAQQWAKSLEPQRTVHRATK